ncbi:hypothetical protein [Pseudoalteromonas luteoviolacea]|uniref:Uncharacterized protein n=1 Tax=Pseudoalteromonas luteoviolacea NCIMB 1942 TaxID=1365253 RepID=A0A167GFV9_9GAMM|nr:hypothetical protein [Pseudoalteromonas luteoviolacea]KZN55019.1 hypothetical protein N482_05535 [Pseudoalteromonas luteoviolacea NCIMB 1942]
MSNTLQRLTGVLTKSHKTIVKVVSVNANGTTLVKFNDGSESVVLGDSVQSGSVYIENGRIIGPAPDLPFTEIEV